MKTGIATVPLDYGRCPRWLFERMRRLSRGIVSAIVEEFGSDELLKRLSNPVWFQSLGCVIGFDYNSSGLTTTTLGALKAGLFEVQDRLGIYVCGGKRVSRKTPEEVEAYSRSRGFDFAADLIYASKMSAKVDSSLIQDGFSLYQHNLIFNKSGNWAVVQQGLNIQAQKARRYHWLSSNLRKDQGKPDFVQEPHSGIISDARVDCLNLVSEKSNENKNVSLELVNQEPKTFLKDIKKISEQPNSLAKKRGKLGFVEMELENVEFYWHPVLREKFDLKRLEKQYLLFILKNQTILKNFCL